MKPPAAILVPLDGSQIALRGLRCAAWLASRLGARLHALNAGEPLPEPEALARLGVADEYRTLLTLHQARGEAAGAILAAVESEGIELIVMTARGESALESADELPRLVGHVTWQVIEEAQVPVLLLPRAYEECLPWRSVLVPISGEAPTDEALQLALSLAAALDLTVTAAHVVDGGRSGGAEPAAGYSDEAHHEYPQLFDELIARACPLCTAEERRRITGFRLGAGDIAQQLLSLIERERSSLLVVGWHGRFAAGHASVLKALIAQARCPVLLAKPRPREPFQLKVGDALA